MIKQIAHKIFSAEQYLSLQMLRNTIYFLVSPKACINMIFRAMLGYDMDWEHPQDLNEKINWLKLYGDTSDWVRLGDKYRMREYVTERGYSDMLVPLIGKWDHVEDIDWDALPQQFVMKMNNGSGDICICRDKLQLDIPYWKKRFAEIFHKKFGLSMGEMHYAKMKPCIIAEELLDCSRQPIETSSLIDYKVWCFNGEVASIWACFNRTKESVQVASYDTSWVKHPEHSISTDHYILSDVTLPRPLSLDQMLQAASVLSIGLPQVRIDFYEVDGKPYVGELTLTSNSGYMNFYTKEYMLELGEKVKLK